MTTSLGLTTQATQALHQLKAGPVLTAALTVASGATPSIGQVLKYDTTDHKWEDFSAFSAGDILAIFADTLVHDTDGTALSADTVCGCIVWGEVNKTALDATAQADDDIEAALIENGIIAKSVISA